MRVGDLVKHGGWGEEGPHGFGVVVEAETDGYGTPGHWVQFFEDPHGWKWYGDDDLNFEVEVISESG